MRRTHRTGILPLLAAAALGVFAPSNASATVVTPMTREALTERSDLIVRATVIAAQSAWSEDHRSIVTLTRVRVASYLKGSGPTELIVRQFGGTVDGVVQLVPGDGRLPAGADVVLFLRNGRGVVYLTALAQSVYYVAQSGTDPMVYRDLSDLTFAVPRDGRMELQPPRAEARESIEHLSTELRMLVRRAR